mgnify:CR=1 FL=1
MACFFYIKLGYFNFCRDFTEKMQNLPFFSCIDNDNRLHL